MVRKMRKRIGVLVLAFAAMIAVFAIVGALSAAKYTKSEITDMSEGTAANCIVTGNEITMTAGDPYVVFDVGDTYISSIEIDISDFTRSYNLADEDEIPMKLYYETGTGFSEQELIISNFYSGKNYIVLYVNEKVQSLRLDLPESEPTSVTIDRIIINPGISFSGYAILIVISAFVILLSFFAAKELANKDTA